jgi:Hypothetical glycosyl hydrolase family 15
MCKSLRRALGFAALTLTALLLTAASAAADTAGTTHFVRSADSTFDSYTSNPSPETQAWLRAHMWRMLVWSPYFDEKTSWYRQGWMYDDSYAIYRESSLVSQHPEWILRDSSANKLYIPYGCAGGTCPQYAGDISNPAFRHYWIEQAKTHYAHGYRGLFVDDVNMEERVSDAAEASVTPVGLAGAISPAQWRAYMAEFMGEIRAAFPGAEIVHNAIWFANGDAGVGDPSIRREVQAANYVMLERGVNDSGITGGGPWSLNAMLGFVDGVHSLGRGVVLDGAASDAQGMEYNLAAYFLISTGNDAVSSPGQTPSSWWPGFDANLGEATDARHAWGNLLRRDFTGGMALVNPPGSATQIVQLPSPMRTAGGATVTTITLPAASGVVLVGAVPSAAPEAAVQTTTQTTLETRVIRAREPYFVNTSRTPTQHGGVARRRAQKVRRHARGRAHAARSTNGRTPIARIAGHVRNATRGSVVVTVERFTRRHWLLARRLSLPLGSEGRFLSLARLGPAGKYRVSATYTGASGYRPSWSGFRLILLGAR